MGLTRDDHARADAPAGTAALDELLVRLADRDVTVRHGAALDLAARPDAAVAVVERALVEPDLAVRELLLTAAAGHDDPEAARLLVAGLRSAEPCRRVGIVDALAQMHRGGGVAVDALATDPDAAVRALAVMLIAARRADDGPDRLAGLAGDADANVAAAAAGELAEVGSARHLPALHAAAGRFPDDDFLAYAVATAAGAIHEREQQR